MTEDQVRDFIGRNHRAVLATRRRDGRVQMSPILAGVDDDGSLVISSRETAMKVHNLRRDPYAALCFINDRFFGEWAFAEGSASIESLPGAMEALVRYYRKVAGEHPDWEDYRAAMQRERRVVIRVTIQRVGPERQG